MNARECNLHFRVQIMETNPLNRYVIQEKSHYVRIQVPRQNNKHLLLLSESPANHSGIETEKHVRISNASLNLVPQCSSLFAASAVAISKLGRGPGRSPVVDKRP
jgi:hypothetical protein